MKPILLFTLIAIAQLTYAQRDTALVFSDVISVDSVTSDELFLRARTWFAKTYKSSSDVLEVNDKQSGELSGNAAITYNYESFMAPDRTLSGFVRYQISVFVKDGRYRYELSNFRHEGSISLQSKWNTGPTNLGLIKHTYRCPRDVRGNWQSDNFWDARWNEVRQLCISEAEAIAQSLGESMKKPSSKASNW